MSRGSWCQICHQQRDISEDDSIEACADGKDDRAIGSLQTVARHHVVTNHQDVGIKIGAEKVGGNGRVVAHIIIKGPVPHDVQSQHSEHIEPEACDPVDDEKDEKDELSQSHPCAFPHSLQYSEQTGQPQETHDSQEHQSVQGII